MGKTLGKEIKKGSIVGITVEPNTDENGLDMFNWTGVLIGPDNTPYEGGKFGLKFSFPPEYPLKPPKVSFTTKIFHCNVNDKGGICLDILKDAWSPALSIDKVCMSIQVLMSSPEPAQSLVPERAALLKNKPEEYKKQAKAWTQKYATGDPVKGDDYANESKEAEKEEPAKEAAKDEKDEDTPAAKSADDVTLKPSVVKK